MIVRTQTCCTAQAYTGGILNITNTPWRLSPNPFPSFIRGIACPCVGVSVCGNPCVTAQRVPPSNFIHVWLVGTVHIPTFLVSPSQTKIRFPTGYDWILQKRSGRTQEACTHKQQHITIRQSLSAYKVYGIIPTFTCLKLFECPTGPKEAQEQKYISFIQMASTWYALHLCSKERCPHHSLTRLVCHWPPG